MEKKFYFLFDENTKEFIPGAVYAEEQPANSTAVDPVDVMYPVWDAKNGMWKSDEDKLAQFNAMVAERGTDPVQAQMAEMTKSFMVQLAANNAKIAKQDAIIKKMMASQGGAN